MSFKVTVDSIREVAVLVNPDGAFINGRKVDASLKGTDTKFPLIVLYPFSWYDAKPSEVLSTSLILMGFYEQDDAASSVIEREASIDRMDKLCSKFLNALANKYKQFGIDRPLREPQYQFHAGTVSGIALKFNYLTFDASCE